MTTRQCAVAANGWCGEAAPQNLAMDGAAAMGRPMLSGTPSETDLANGTLCAPRAIMHHARKIPHSPLLKTFADAVEI